MVYLFLPNFTSLVENLKIAPSNLNTGICPAGVKRHWNVSHNSVGMQSRSPTILGMMIQEVRVFAPHNFFRQTYSFTTRRCWKVPGKCTPFDVKPITSEPLVNPVILKTGSAMELPTNPDNFIRVAQGMCTCGVFKCHKAYSFGGVPHPTPALMRWNLAWESRPMPYFTPIGEPQVI